LTAPSGGQAARGHRKRVVCYLTESAGNWGGASRVLFSNLRVMDRTRYEPLVLLPNAGPVVPLLDELAVPYIVWGKAQEPNGMARYTRAIARSILTFRRRGVELLHVNGTNYWRPAEVLAARLLRIPIITHYHVVVDRVAPFIRYSKLIVAVSAFTARASEPKSIPKAVIHNCVALERFDRTPDIRSDLGLSPADVVVSFVGQIREIKGIDLFLRLAHAIAAPDARFLVVGECRNPERFAGSYTEARLREEMGNDSRIRYLGYRRDVENIYGASDIVVVPSRGGEPFGLINIEAGAARKPVVATRDGGISEVIVDGENGFLVDPEDLEGLVRATERLIDDKALRQRMGERGRRIVEEQFTTRPVRELERVYDRLLSADGGSVD